VIESLLFEGFTIKSIWEYFSKYDTPLELKQEFIKYIKENRDIKGGYNE